MFTIKWLKDAAERVISTAAEALLGTLPVSDVHWGQKLGITGLAALASLLKAIVASRVGDPTNAGLVNNNP